MKWIQAQRAEKMNPSVIREILKVTEKPGIISFAGGLPSPRTFPVDAFAAACATVLKTDGRAALQSFVTASVEQINIGVAALAEAIAESRALKIGEPSPPPSPGGRGSKSEDLSPAGVI